MRLRAGSRYYQNRNAQDQPVLVKHKGSGNVGVVHRVTPSGNHIPPQAYVVFSNDNWTTTFELWCPLRELETVGS